MTWLPPEMPDSSKFSMTGAQENEGAPTGRNFGADYGLDYLLTPAVVLSPRVAEIE